MTYLDDIVFHSDTREDCPIDVQNVLKSKSIADLHMKPDIYNIYKENI